MIASQILAEVCNSKQWAGDRARGKIWQPAAVKHNEIILTINGRCWTMGEMRDVFFHICRAISQLTLGRREVKTVSKSGFKISKKLMFMFLVKGK